MVSPQHVIFESMAVHLQLYSTRCTTSDCQISHCQSKKSSKNFSPPFFRHLFLINLFNLRPIAALSQLDWRYISIDRLLCISSFDLDKLWSIRVSGIWGAFLSFDAFSPIPPRFFSPCLHISVGGCFYCLQCWDGLYFFFYNDGCFYGFFSWLSLSRIARDFHDQIEGFRVLETGSLHRDGLPGI